MTAQLTERLAAAGFVSAHEEAGELVARAGGDVDLLESMVARRMTGEPLAWIIGSTTFCDLVTRVDSGVYVPRWQSEPLARRAVERLPDRGVGIDLCTGSGAIAKTLSVGRPAARVVASDLDDRSVACARGNGVDAFVGDLFVPLPRELESITDVVVAVVPYVPTPELPMLQRDTFTFEGTLSYDGGPDGTDMLRRALVDATRFLRAGGGLLLELGGDQADLIRGDLETHGYGEIRVMLDEDGDVRGVEATFGDGV